MAGNPNWKPGVSGNIGGKSKTAWLTSALKMELSQNPKRARTIANKIIELAEEGDLAAANIIFDRTEGKPTQAIEVNTTVTNLSADERRTRVLELQTKLINASASEPEDVEFEEVPRLKGPKQ
jgi:hypothetical protein